MVESNTTGTGRTFAVAARARGLRPVLLSSRPERYPWVAEDDVDVALADTADAASVADVARTSAPGAGLAGLVTSSEYFVAVTARVAVRLGLPGPDPGAVERCRDKRRQRQALQGAGVPVPAFAAAASPQEAIEAALAIGLPVVVKPADGTGSRGVRLCCDPAEVADHTAGLLARRRDERGRPTIPAVLVEEYVAGPEVSVETFGTEIVGITTKHLGPQPWFVEHGHDFPADPEDAAVGPCLSATGGGEGPYGASGATGCAQAAIEALGLGFGPAHTEIRVEARGPVVIEVNPRLAGGRIPTLVRLATGLDLVGATVDAVIGEDRPLPEPGPGHASIRFLVPPHAGRVRRTAGVAAAAAVPGVVDVAISARAGQRVGGTGSFLDRVGHVITAAPTAPAARAAADTALSLLELDIDVEQAAMAVG
jgi:biotin carboxylase